MHSKFFRFSIATLASSLQRCCIRSFKKVTSPNSAPHVRMSLYKKGLVACATAVGVSALIAHRNMLACEIEPTTLEHRENETINYRTYNEVIKKSRDILQRIKDEKGIPGIVVGVSIDGQTIWTEGLGYADVENRVLCSPDTVMRIASISKSITMAAVAKLWEQGKLDLDKPVQEYVPSFPQKTFNGKPVSITCRQLVSHLGGIRHYSDEKYESKKVDGKSNKITKWNEEELESKEYYLAVKFDDTESALEIFKNDPLVEKPGTKFHYTTFGWTLVSAIVEAVSKEKFTLHITKLFKALGMKNTYLDENDVIIYHRSRNYMKNKRGLLINTPYLDNSYKWAGGGFLSTVGDLMQFANAMLYSTQYKSSTLYESSGNNKNESFNHGRGCQNKDVNNNPSIKCDSIEDSFSVQKKLLPGFLTSKTMETMWTPAGSAAPRYGMGWSVCPQKQECQFCDKTNFSVYHTGSAVGASSVLLVVPKMSDINKPLDINTTLPKGIVVVILTNMHNVSLSETANKIASLFDNL